MRKILYVQNLLIIFFLKILFHNCFYYNKICIILFEKKTFIQMTIDIYNYNSCDFNNFTTIIDDNIEIYIINFI